MRSQFRLSLNRPNLRQVLECGGWRGTGLTPLWLARSIFDVGCWMPAPQKAVCALTPHPPQSKTLSGPTLPHSHWRGFGQLLCVFSLLSVLRSAVPLQAQTPSPHDYAAVDAIFSQHCLDCHSAPDAEGQFVLESFDALMKGGEIGPAIVPGKSDASLLVQMIEGRFEKEGKKKIMPPGKRKKLV